MATITAHSANLATAQVAAGDTNILDRGTQNYNMPALVRVVTTIGGSPTATFAIVGSVDGVTWYPIPYADSGTPATFTCATFSQNTAVTSYKYLQPAPWRYLKVTLSVVNNVTSTVDVMSGE